MERAGRVILVAWLIVAAVLCVYVPWRAEAQGTQQPMGYAPIWAPPPPHNALTRYPRLDLSRWFIGVAGASAVFGAVMVLASKPTHD